MENSDTENQEEAPEMVLKIHELVTAEETARAKERETKIARSARDGTLQDPHDQKGKNEKLKAALGANIKKLYATNYDDFKEEFDREVFSVLKGKGTKLDWAMFETRLRDVILEIVEPLRDDTKLHVQKTSVLHQDLAIQKRMIQELTFDMMKVNRQSNEFH